MKRLIIAILFVGLALFLVGPGVIAAPFRGQFAASTFGLNQGNATYGVAANVWNGMWFLNTAGAGHISKVELLVDDRSPSGVVRMGVYGATPCTLIKDLGYVRVSNGWVSIGGLNIPVSAGSYYYLAFDLQRQNQVRVQKNYAASNSGFGCWFAPLAYNALLIRTNSAEDMPPGGHLSPDAYVIRATVSH
jgi:hypothetical protein